MEKMNIETKNIGDPENEKNDLLLKFDNEKEQFFFSEHPIKKALEKKKIQEEKLKSLEEVQYINGKIIINKVQEITGKKRRREEEKETESGQNLNTKNNKLNKKLIHIVKESGKSYKGKVSGDVKLAGKPDPYAYIQLNPKVFYLYFFVI